MISSRQAEEDVENDSAEAALDLDEAGDDEDTYNVEQILAAGDFEGHDDVTGEPIEVKKWLVKWENYGMHECTWEPRENFSEGIIENWENQTAEMSETELAAMFAQNEADFEKACQKHKRQMQLAKRLEQTRKRQSHVVIESSSDSEDDQSLIDRHRRNEEGFNQAAKSLAEREAEDASQLNTLFIDENGPPTPGSDAAISTTTPMLTKGTTLRQRQAPIQQSESSPDSESFSGEMDTSDDSLLGEIQPPDRDETSRSVLIEAGPERQNGPQKSNEAPKQSKIAQTTPSLKLNTGSAPVPKNKPKPAERPQDPSPPRPSINAVTLGHRNSDKFHKVTVLPVHTESTGRSQKRPLQRPDVQSTSGPTAPTRAKRTEPGVRSIRIVNEQVHRRQRNDSSRLYKNMSSVRRAELASRNEGIPDASVLAFVGAAPTEPRKAARQRSGGDVYGRRETANQRAQEEFAAIVSEPEAQKHAASALSNIKRGKAPLVCPNWRLGNDCSKGPERCEFLHRHKDPNGNYYQVADISRYMPPKYRDPPVTCSFWLENPQGCSKSPAVCDYAHWDTGLRARPLAGSLNGNDLQRSAQEEDSNPKKSLNTGPREKTCFYWTRDSCRKHNQICSFAHYDTGLIADPPPINTTCRQWKEGKCSTIACKFPHRDGGFLAPMTQQELRETATNPEMKMRRLEDLPPPKLTISLLKQQIEAVLKTNFDELFNRVNSTSDRSPPHYIAFLAYHPEKDIELIDLLTRYLLMFNVEVCNTWEGGAWEYFRIQVIKSGEGVIIASPQFDHYSLIPGIARVLQRKVRCWSIGIQEGYEYIEFWSPEPPSVRHDCIEIFPFGGFIYMTDDVFEKQPKLALKIVQLFIAKIEKLRQKRWIDHLNWLKIQDAQIPWRLCVRPELLEYLYEHCEARFKELDEGDEDVTSRADLYKILKDSEYIEQDDPEEPLSGIADKYPIISLRRVLGECDAVDYFSTLTSSQQQANLNMIRYFVGLQIDLRRNYRHFYVVHTEPDASYIQEWKYEMQTIAGVLTPASCVAELSKDDVDSTFDFLERYMNELNY